MSERDCKVTIFFRSARTNQIFFCNVVSAEGDVARPISILYWKRKKSWMKKKSRGSNSSAPQKTFFKKKYIYILGPAGTNALPAALNSNLWKFLMKRSARSRALLSHSAASL